MKKINFRVIACGGAADGDAIHAGAAVLTEMGYSVSFGEHLFERYRYLAGTAAQRIHDLRAALIDPDVDVIWIARAGFGSSELLPLLGEERFPRKTIIGFSDNGILLAELARRGIYAIHGPLFEDVSSSEGGIDGASGAHLSSLQRVREVIDLIERARTSAAGTCIKTFNVSHRGGPGSPVAGKMVGGNLSTVVAAVGTPWELDFSGRIVILEDVGEPLYRIERMILQLKLSGSLQRAAAVCLGEFLDCDNSPRGGVADIFAEHVLSFGCPLYTNLSVGHGQVNLPWVVDGDALLNGTELRLLNGELKL